MRFGRLVDVTHRYRLDKDNLAVRRNEVDLTLGTNQTYVQVGYLRLDRNIGADDRGSARQGGVAARRAGQVPRLLVAVRRRPCSTSPAAAKTRLSDADGFQPVRLRMGLNYEDDCLDLGVSWKRDYERIGDFRKGSTLSFNISLKGLGR